jgi:CP family cyanate transporter-like MFS transporter
VAGNLRTAITAVGPVLPAIEEAYGLASTTASVLVSLPLLAFASVSPFAPRFARALGLERSIALALAMLVVGLAVRSVPPVALLWLGTALIGIAIAVLNVVLPALVKRDFPTKIGQVTGAYSAVQSSFAAIAAGVAVPVAGMSDLGWRLPLGMWAGLALITLGVLAPQLRRRTVPNPGTVSAPVVRGRSPWGSAIAWQVTGFMGLQSVVFYVFVTWLPAIEHSAGISEEAAGLHSFLLNAVAIGGSLLSSALIPRLRQQWLISMGGPVITVIATVGILLAPEWAALWASALGLAGGANIVLALSLFGLRTTNHADAAAMSGMAQCIGYLVAAAGPIAIGAVHEASGSWGPSLVLVVVAVELPLIVFGFLAGRDRILR